MSKVSLVDFHRRIWLVSANAESKVSLVELYKTDVVSFGNPTKGSAWFTLRWSALGIPQKCGCVSPSVLLSFEPGGILTRHPHGRWQLGSHRVPGKEKKRKKPGPG